MRAHIGNAYMMMGEYAEALECSRRRAISRM